jgi:hypothetical protein
MEWLASEFARRCRRGERTTIAEYAAEYPEYAARLQELLPAVVMLEQLRTGDQAVREAASSEASDKSTRKV